MLKKAINTAAPEYKAYMDAKTRFSQESRLLSNLRVKLGPKEAWDETEHAMWAMATYKYSSVSKEFNHARALFGKWIAIAQGNAPVRPDIDEITRAVRFSAAPVPSDKELEEAKEREALFNHPIYGGVIRAAYDRVQEHERAQQNPSVEELSDDMESLANSADEKRDL